MKKYDSYKDSGIEWIGDIPSSWKVKKLKFIGNLYSGLSGKSGSDFSSEATTNTKPFINFTNVANNKYIVSDNFGYVVLAENENQNKVEKGDLLFLMSSENQEEVGKSSLLNEDYGELYLNSFCKGLRISNSEIYPNFLNYQLNSSVLSKLVSLEGRGFTRINLRMEGVENLPVLFPEFKEQTAIANYLDHKTNQIDHLIAKKEQLIQLLEEERVAVINQAVTKGLDPNISMKDSGIEWLGQIPKHWEVKRMNFISTKIGDGLHGTPNYVDESVFPFINGNNIGEGVIMITDRTKFVSEEEYISNQKTLTSNTILMSINGTIGNLAFYNGESIMLGKSVAYINLESHVNKDFIYYYLKSEIAKDYISMELSGSTIKNLSLYSINKTPIPYPAKDEQLEIVNYIKTKMLEIRTIISKTNQEIELLKEYKTALISEVVTGKVDVRDEKLN